MIILCILKQVKISHIFPKRRARTADFVLWAYLYQTGSYRCLAVYVSFLLPAETIVRFSSYAGLGIHDWWLLWFCNVHLSSVPVQPSKCKVSLSTVVLYNPQPVVSIMFALCSCRHFITVIEVCKYLPIDLFCSSAYPRMSDEYHHSLLHS